MKNLSLPGFWLYHTRTMCWLLFILSFLVVFCTVSAHAEEGLIQIKFTSAGVPLEDATVSLYEDDEYLDDLSYDYSKGLFYIPTAPGTYNIEFLPYTSGFGSLLIKDVVVQAGQVTIVEQELGPLVPVQVTPVFAGTPLRNALVFIDDASGNAVALLDWDEASGSFIGKVTANTWTLRIDPNNSDIERGEVKNFTVISDGPNQVSVNLRPLQTLQIQLLAGQEACEDASITLMHNDEHVDYARYNEATMYWEAKVVEGTYTAVIKPYNFFLYDNKTVTVSTAEVTTVQLGAETQLTLHVNSPYGIPYPFARVQLVKADSDSTSAYWDKGSEAYSATVLEGTYDITITPDGFFSPQTLQGVKFEGDSIELSIELIKRAALAQVDITQTISKAELLAIAKQYQEQYLSRLDFMTRQNVEQQLKLLDEAEDTVQYHLVQQFSGASIMFGAAAMAKELSLIFGASAVLAAPDDALLLSNFGAVLMLAEFTMDAIKVLNYGRLISPDSPLILTNLANALLAMGDDRQAEELLLQVLRYEPDFAEAHTSLVSVYLGRGNTQTALDHLFKAAEKNYTLGMRQAAQQAKAAGAQAPAPRSSSGTSGSSDQGTPDVHNSLLIPRLPNWSTRDALNANAASLKTWGSDIIENGLTKPSNMAMELYKSRQSTPGLDKAYGGPYSQLVFEIECYGQYLQDRVVELYDQFTANLSGPTEAWSAQIEEIGAQQVARWEIAGRKIEQATGLNVLYVGRESLLEMDVADQQAGRDRRAATDRYFVIWRDLFRNTYEEVARLVEEYWIYTESPASRIYDPDTAEYVHEMRRMQVYIAFLPLAFHLPVQMLNMEIGGFESILRPLGEPIKLDTPEAMETVQVPPPKKDNCPLKDGKSFSPDAGFLSFKVTCETIEIKAGEVIKGSVTWNFKHKYVSSLYLGAATPGTGLVQVGVEGGLRANFGPNGEVLGVAPEGGFTGNIGGDFVGGMLSGSASTGDGLVVNGGGHSMSLW